MVVLERAKLKLTCNLNHLQFLSWPSARNYSFWFSHISVHLVSKVTNCPFAPEYLFKDVCMMNKPYCLLAEKRAK